jgi:hemerythrin-like metal-binding protein
MLIETELLNPQHVANVKDFWKFHGFQLGIPFIDTQHAWLVSLVLRLNAIIKTSHDDQLDETFHRAIAEAFEYADSHFKAEEALFSAFYFPEREKHIKQHGAFIHSIKKLVSQSQKLDRSMAEKLFRYLRHWLSEHILKEDRKYAQFLRQRKSNLDSFFEERALDGDFILSEEQLELFSQVNSNKDTKETLDKESLIREKIRDIWNRFKLKLDIPLIDIQHLWLIKVAFRLEMTMHESPENRQQEVKELLQEAVLYVTEHFHTEEYLMEKLDYPYLLAHKQKHALLVNSVLERKAEIEGGNDRAANLLAIDLKEWLFSHIALEDKKFSQIVRENRNEGIRLTKMLIEDKEVKIRKGQLELYKNIVLGV